MGAVYYSPADRPDGRGGSKKRGGFPRAVHDKNHRMKKSELRKQNIAVFDTETDPFDHLSGDKIFPFCGVLYSDNFEPVIIWEQDHEKFVDAVILAIEALPDSYTIYAHNGGKFDFLFLIHRLRGDVKFKGRGIMCARIGAHELRDSFHIIPEKLASYQKDVFDYTKLVKARRETFRDEIIRYCLNDCRYLLDIIKKFVNNFGLKISIGQAAFAQIKEHYDVERFSKGWDAEIRQFYFGGRSECIRGAGHFTGDYKLIDANSMYPFVMAHYQHPVGCFHDYEITGGPIRENTIFIELACKNRGALVARDPVTGETTSRIGEGVFKTTIWEFETAIKHGLISDIDIIACYDCAKRTNFSKFVNPLYSNRLLTKQLLSDMKRDGLDECAKFHDVKKDDIFYKLLLNNGYGKFCQDPTRYKEHFLTDPGERPDENNGGEKWWSSIYELEEEERVKYLQPCFESDRYWIWCKPSPGFRYNNVGTGASITGAARAVLLDALQYCTSPIYCDTDGIICTAWDERQLRIHKTELGAWDIEDEFSEVIITGKKLYSVKHKTPKRRTQAELEMGLSPEYTIKSKGASGMTWRQMIDILEGHTVPLPNRAPTLTKFGTQYYLSRNIKRTAELATW